MKFLQILRFPVQCLWGREMLFGDGGMMVGMRETSDDDVEKFKIHFLLQQQKESSFFGKASQLSPLTQLSAAADANALNQHSVISKRQRKFRWKWKMFWALVGENLLNVVVLKN